MLWKSVIKWLACSHYPPCTLYPLQYAYLYAVPLFHCGYIMIIYLPYSKDQGILWFYVEAACCQPPATHLNGLNMMTWKPQDSLFSNSIHTFYIFKHQFLTTFLSCTKLKGGIATHLSVHLSARPSTFSGFCASAYKSLWSYGLYFDMLIYSGDLGLAAIDTYGYYCPSVHSSGYLGLGLLGLELGLSSLLLQSCCHHWRIRWIYVAITRRYGWSLLPLLAANSSS